MTAINIKWFYKNFKIMRKKQLLSQKCEEFKDFYLITFMRTFVFFFFEQW